MAPSSTLRQSFSRIVLERNSVLMARPRFLLVHLWSKQGPNTTSQSARCHPLSDTILRGDGLTKGRTVMTNGWASTFAEQLRGVPPGVGV
eukprot:1116717-Amphidinium_carterae.1